MQQQNPNEGMSGISPRYVMNRLGEVASKPGVSCIMPLMALDSMWRGLDQNISLGEIDVTKYVAIVSNSRARVQQSSNQGDPAGIPRIVRRYSQPGS